LIAEITPPTSPQQLSQPVVDFYRLPAVYAYRVDWKPRAVDRLLRSPHGTEMPQVFGTKVPREFVGSGPEVDALSDRLMSAWLNFARSGNPSQERHS
jgi:para-nitrobenzyl esterase